MTYLMPMGDAVPVSPVGPYFIPDIYEFDIGRLPNFDALAALPNMVGCILKATENVTYFPQWFVDNWPRARAAGGSRYGTSWFRLCYHFGRPWSPGAAQADFLLAAVDRAGGWGDGDGPPIYDLEGESWGSDQQIIDVSSAFAERIKQRTGRTPILYAGSTIRDRGITNHMGFGKFWSPHVKMEKAGWSLPEYALWQYGGDGGPHFSGGKIHGYDMRSQYPQSGALAFPMSVPGWGATDMSVVMKGGMPATTIEEVRSVLTGRGGSLMPLLLGAALAAGYLLYRRGA